VNSSCRHAFESICRTEKEYLAALICISVAGQVLQSFLLYAGKNLMNTWCRGEGAQYDGTKRVSFKRCSAMHWCLFYCFLVGWIDKSMFEYWLENMFITSTAHLNRLLLITINHHASHIGLKILDLLKEHQIVCLIVPSNSIHVSQSWDVVVFNGVKANRSSLVKNQLKDEKKDVKNYNFPRLMKKLFIDKLAFSPCRIISSYARAGKPNPYNVSSNCDSSMSI
jgi:hypothetical protein